MMKGIKEKIDSEWNKEEYPSLLTPSESKELLTSIKVLINERKERRSKRKRQLLIYYGAAATLILGMLVTYNLVVKKPYETLVADVDSRIVNRVDIAAPALSKATITLESGEVILLDEIEKDPLVVGGAEIAKEGSSSAIVYKGDAQLVNNFVSQSSEIAVSMNTLTNPRGSDITTIVLNDGSRVTLNAGSSIRYPTLFTGSTRRVSLIGEAYFEVAHNSSAPFIISLESGIEVKVLGTSFNISAYGDDSYSAVTLVEGSVELSQPNLKKGIRLVPNEQAIIDNANKIEVREINPKEYISWKENLFYFNDTSLESIMVALSRWYNIEYYFNNDTLKEMKFGAVISRRSNISEILNLIQKTGSLSFEIDNKKIIISKK